MISLIYIYLCYQTSKSKENVCETGELNNCTLECCETFNLSLIEDSISNPSTFESTLYSDASSFLNYESSSLVNHKTHNEDILNAFSHKKGEEDDSNAKIRSNDQLEKYKHNLRMLEDHINLKNKISQDGFNNFSFSWYNRYTEFNKIGDVKGNFLLEEKNLKNDNFKLEKLLKLFLVPKKELSIRLTSLCDEILYYTNSYPIYKNFYFFILKGIEKKSTFQVEYHYFIEYLLIIIVESFKMFIKMEVNENKFFYLLKKFICKLKSDCVYIPEIFSIELFIDRNYVERYKLCIIYVLLKITYKLKNEGDLSREKINIMFFYITLNIKNKIVKMKDYFQFLYIEDKFLYNLVSVFDLLDSQTKFFLLKNLRRTKNRIRKDKLGKSTFFKIFLILNVFLFNETFCDLNPMQTKLKKKYSFILKNALILYQQKYKNISKKNLISSCELIYNFLVLKDSSFFKE